MTQSLRERLGLPACGTDVCNVSGFGGHSSGPQEVDIVKLRVKSNFGEHLVIEAVVVPVVCGPLPRQRPKSASLNYPHLQNVILSDFTDDPQMQVDVLIEGDYFWSFVAGNVIRGPNRQDPVAMETTIGWVLSGQNKFYPQDDTHCSVTISLSCSVDSKLDELKKFWEDKDTPASISDVMQQFKKDVEFNGNKYVVKLPFKSDDEFLPDNRRSSERRLDTLCKFFDKQPQHCDSYDKLIKQYEREGIIEKVASDDVGELGRTHYLGHRLIIREDRDTTKESPAFDASAKSFGPSWNDHLLPGPNLLSWIFDVLLRF